MDCTRGGGWGRHWVPTNWAPPARLGEGPRQSGIRLQGRGGGRSKALKGAEEGEKSVPQGKCRDLGQLELSACDRQGLGIAQVVAVFAPLSHSRGDALRLCANRPITSVLLSVHLPDLSRHPCTHASFLPSMPFLVI